MYLGAGNAIAIHPSGENVAVASSSGSVRIYSIKERKLKQHYVLHDNTTSIDWHPYANFLITSGTEGKIIITDVLEGRAMYTLNTNGDAVNSIAFSQDGSYFLSGGAERIIRVLNNFLFF